MDLYSRQILGWSLWENLEAGARCTSGVIRAASFTIPVEACNTPAGFTVSNCNAPA